MEICEPVSVRLFDRLLSMLVYEHIPVNRERGNSGTGRSICFGLVGKRCAPIGTSRATAKRPGVWEELQKISTSLPVPEGWTSCVVNMDYSCLPHFDSGNVGNSCIVSFGSYTGGELVLDLSGGKMEVNTYLKPVVGDFSKTRHWTKPLSGLKFSLVYFKIDPERSKKGRKKQKAITEDEVMKYVDAEHMFNPVAAVSRTRSGRAYLAIDTPNPPWAGLKNPTPS